MPQLLIGFIAAVLIAFVAYRAHSLNRSGILGAVIVGTIIFGMGGWQWAILLLTFFLSSSFLTRLFSKRKIALSEKFEKGGQRDIYQVLANSAIASIFAGLHLFFPQVSWTWTAFAGSLAAVNADTWATELGVLNPTPPRMITSSKHVARGTSGAISLYGILAAIAGAALIAILAGLLNTTVRLWSFSGIIIFSGLCGSLFDSLLGATVQGIFYCPKCKKETEHNPTHICGIRTKFIRGWKWLDNDLVNLACAAVGAIVGLLL